MRFQRKFLVVVTQRIHYIVYEIVIAVLSVFDGIFVKINLIDNLFKRNLVFSKMYIFELMILFQQQHDTNSLFFDILVFRWRPEIYFCSFFLVGNWKFLLIHVLEYGLTRRLNEFASGPILSWTWEWEAYSSVNWSFKGKFPADFYAAKLEEMNIFHR